MRTWQQLHCAALACRTVTLAAGQPSPSSTTPVCPTRCTMWWARTWWCVQLRTCLQVGQCVIAVAAVAGSVLRYVLLAFGMPCCGRGCCSSAVQTPFGLCTPPLQQRAALHAQASALCCWVIKPTTCAITLCLNCALSPCTGQELTVSYLGREDFAPAAARKAVLQERFGFDCDCQRCR